MSKIIYFCTFLLFFSLSANATTLSISTGFNDVESMHLKKVLQEVFSRTDIKLNFQHLPNKRSLLNANSGVFDGEAARIWKINKTYKNLIPIAPEVHSIDIVVLSHKPIYIKTLLDLHPYRIGVVRGVKISEVLGAKAQPKELIKTTNYKNLIKMLLADRIDFVIVNKLGLFTDLREIQNQTFYMRKKPLKTVKVYMQLNKKHKKLVPIFEKAFVSLHEDGTYKKMYQSFLHSITNSFAKSLEVIEYD